MYDNYEPADGYRILVDRLWPRGMTKADAYVDNWSKEAAPSAALRKWFNHEPEKWIAFKKAYMIELKNNTALDELISIIRTKKKVTLLSAVKDTAHSHALVLQEVIKKAMKK